MMTDIEAGKVSTVITKDLSRLGRNYLKTGEYIEIIFPDYDVRYIAINDNVDTFKSENELLAFKNIFNDWYARDCSKKIKAVFKAKGQSGKPLSKPVYGYKISEMDKHQWVIDEEAANVVRRIFKLCIDGYGPSKIARILTEENVLNPTAYALSQGRDNGHRNANLNRWDHKMVASILERPEYCGHTVNFRTRRKSYNVKKTIRNPQENWMIFENTHEPIITQQQFDLVQDLRKNKRRPQRFEEINPFSGMVYCADCGKKMYLCRSSSFADDQEHLKCSTYAYDTSACTVHYIRTFVLKEIVLKAMNKLLVTVKDNEDEFVQSAMESSATKHSSSLFKARKVLAKTEKRIAELSLNIRYKSSYMCITVKKAFPQIYYVLSGLTCTMQCLTSGNSFSIASCTFSAVSWASMRVFSEFMTISTSTYILEPNSLVRNSSMPRTSSVESISSFILSATSSGQALSIILSIASMKISMAAFSMNMHITTLAAGSKTGAPSLAPSMPINEPIEERASER